VLLLLTQVKQSASTFRKEKEKAQTELDHASKLSALKKKHKLKMTALKAEHTAERKKLRSELAKWENGVSLLHIMT
jgi:hypothetical protein